MHILIAPDKFKGSLTSGKVCEYISAGLLSTRSDCKIVSIPLADGGDGFAAILKSALETSTITCESVDPLGRPFVTSYEWHDESKTAIVELAASSGLVLLAPEERNPLETSTLGTGLIIKNAIERGASRILLGLGGSATNDAGIGILSALGYVFEGPEGEELAPGGKSLARIRSVRLPKALPEISLLIACDVSNPLYGPNGAASVYAPQKGASPLMVEQLDAGLRSFNEVLIRTTGRDNAFARGAGAAGGIAAGLMAFFPVELRAGIEIVSELVGLEEAILAADLVITGEGQIDTQSIQGKVLGHVARLAMLHHRPLVAFAGKIALDQTELERLGFIHSSALIERAPSLEYAMKNAGPLLQQEAAKWLAEIK